MGLIRIGTASWTDKTLLASGWYPDDAKSAEERSDLNSIVLMRHGAFSRHFGKKQFTADVNQATFFAKDSVYQV